MLFSFAKNCGVVTYDCYVGNGQSMDEGGETPKPNLPLSVLTSFIIFVQFMGPWKQVRIDNGHNVLGGLLRSSWNRLYPYI